MNKPQKKLMILAGGTGGHIYPALAVAEKLVTNDVKIIWLGTKKGLEGRINFPDYVENEWIEIKGVIGKGVMSWITMPFRLLSAVTQSMSIIKKHQPDLVLGTGGFVAAPGGIAAFIKRVPLIIHESNAVAGLTNKMLSKIADKTLVAIAETKGLNSQQIVVGNPVRKSLVDLLDSEHTIKQASLNITEMHKEEFAVTQTSQFDNNGLENAGLENTGLENTGLEKTVIENSSSEAPVRISIVGGSQGAQAFNEVLPSALGGINIRALVIKHQTGKNKLSGIAEAYQQANKQGLHEVEVFEYVEDMANLYRHTDLIICRAGAMTIAEIALAGLPAIIVPYPNSAGDHQLANAQYYQLQHAGTLIEQDQFNQESVQQVVKKLLANPEKLAQMSKRAKLIAVPDAADKAAKICWETINA